MALQPIRILVLLLTLALGVGCSDPVADSIGLLQQQNKSKLTVLKQQLEQGKIRNAMLLGQYAKILSKQRPQLAPLLEQLALDATTSGPLYSNLRQRVNDSNNSANFTDQQQLLEELENLNQALDPNLFNDALSDPLNVIADLSQGSLARVNSISQAQEQMANQSQNFGAGSQLVGNPNYGSWNSGTSFWQWYGMYAMFSNLTSGGIGYDRWGRHRGYSYYNDYGRYLYSSPKQRKQQQATWDKTKKKFSTGQRYNTPYSKSRAGASGLSRSSSRAQTAAGKGFSTSSKFSKQRASSSYSNSSSFRNSRSNTSRGVSRSK